MIIYGKTFSKKELLKRAGNIRQLFGTRHYELTEGNTKGTKAIDVTTGSGFDFTVVPDRGLDISLASYKGINLVYRTQNGEVNPSFYNPQGIEWLRTFFAGLLTTCGLTYLGPPGVDQGIELGLHGQYSAVPAKQVCDNSHWVNDDYLIEISGIIDNSTLYSEKICMKRIIKSKAGEKSLLICDTVENYGDSPSPFTMLYHINPGFPLLDAASGFIASSNRIEAYDQESKNVMDKYDKFSEPVKGINEFNFFHIMKTDVNGYAYAALLNRNLFNGIGLYIKFKGDSLPYLTQWKMAGEIDYALGIEPCNTKCENRAILREQNKLPFLKPGEKKHMEVEIGVLEGAEEIEAFISIIDSI